MQYVKYLKDALANFERELAQDELRINKAVNELESLNKKNEAMKREIEQLDGMKASVKSELADIRTKHEEALAKREMEANELTKKAHDLFAEATKSKKQAENDAVQVQKELEAANKAKEYWEDKKAALSVAMGV